MTWLAVAKKDFRDAVQSRALWALVAVFVLLSVGSTYAYVEVPELFGGPAAPTLGGLLFFTVGLTGLFVPLAAIVVCQKSLAGERELGSIKLLLSLPTNRRHVFFGTVLGRASVLAFGLGVGLLVGLGVGALLLGRLEPVPMAVFVLVTLAFAAVYAAIVTSLSATTGSTTRATALALGFFVVFELVWDVVPLGVLYVVSGFSLPAESPDWLALLAQVPPSSAYFSTAVAFLPDLASDAGAAAGGGAGTDGATYAAPEVGVLVLTCWLAVVLAVGYTRFAAADL
ncbi:ABC transporter permease [Natronobiforma cellulositropha]|uniref:ABC transporter permease n=1 Tax=Natronobiforma cellulositropha TaxID=1679076 RepID=UPI0021D5C4F8|nr:ABC transporter permease [Natronobiforma cellulositropha]